MEILPRYFSHPIEPGKTLDELTDEDYVFQLFPDLPEMGRVVTLGQAKREGYRTARRILEIRDNSRFISGSTFLITEVVIRLGAGCNLACDFCIQGVQADKRFAGASNPKARLNLQAAQALIDHLQFSAKQLGLSEVQVVLSGGEPTLFWDLLVEIVEYARASSRDGVPVIIGLQSNFARLSEEQIEYLAQNIDAFKISFDGLPEIHDKSRPKVGSGKSVTTEVIRNVQSLLFLRTPYVQSDDMGVLMNAVFVEALFGRMQECFAFMRDTFNGARIKLSPRVNFQRSDYDYHSYLTQLIELMRGMSDEDRLYFDDPFAQFQMWVQYCHVSGRGVELMPDGTLSSCSAAMQSYEIFKAFQVGKFNEESGELNWDEEQLIKLAQLGIDANHPCYKTQCPLIATCAGGCHHQRDAQTGLPIYWKQGVCGLMRDAMVVSQVPPDLD